MNSNVVAAKASDYQYHPCLCHTGAAQAPVFFPLPNTTGCNPVSTIRVVLPFNAGAVNG